MNMITLPKREYNEILKRQARTDSVVKRLVRTEAVVESLVSKIKVLEREQDEELLPGVAERLEHQSKLMDEGKGKHFKNMKEVRAYFRSL